MTMNALFQEFHVSRFARDRYQFDDFLFATNGEVIFANFHAARVFAQKMNARRDLVSFPEQAIRASQINALGLIHEVAHHLVRWYRQTKNPALLADMLSAFSAQVGAEAVDAMLRRFVGEFPPLAVYKREQTIDEYLAGATEGMPNRELLMEELLLLWLENSNPAFTPFQELFDDAALERDTTYAQVTAALPAFFAGQLRLGPGGGGGDDGSPVGAGTAISSGQTLLDLLLAPIRAHPHSLEGQLDYVRQSWGAVLGRYVYRVLGSLDMIHEEEKPLFFGGFDSASLPIPDFRHDPSVDAPENFTLDREWMPRVVMIAKNAYVWLDQLSKQYDRPIRTLADIPDEELDRYRSWGITGLWLIGLWERSEASKRIKQMMGNTDAVASAYSLYDYQIAAALGGEAACDDLRQRAWQRGIRLASDMVPNHVGIDGRWVVERPDFFVQSDFPPFPAYTFEGPNLSHDDRAGIYLEDHYFTKTDAAVVFKRVDQASGQASYIYHGNDGTSMPWNDTAQLNYLNPEVREQIIQTILHVARQFPIIRFDAAMTLAKKHFQRLWFPEPGTGGDIASRADFAMSKAQFDQLMPQEFWREVVDRAAVEAPDTLLLAEAFWLMESYFVRTLGMHRVYNSAFMHLLRDEENAKYRMLMKNTLEFDPEILKRYVNFMNNPDEKAAVEQFGKGDKYFGVLTVMLTLPGLPMFGHGQIEGYAEKYGMEYQRAYFHESPDQYLIERHEREIFPLTHKRYLFANVDHFLLYDFATTDGGVNENVYAYSNRHGEERGLVVYHNAYGTVRGWIRSSAAYMAREDGERALRQKTLGEGLELHGGDEFTIFRDHTAGLEFIRPSRELIERGLYVELGAYRCQVFLDFRQVQDDAQHSYRDLANYLSGRGVPSVEEAIQETFLRPIHQPLRALLHAELFGELNELVAAVGKQEHDPLAPEPAWADEVDELPGLADDLAETTELESVALADDEMMAEDDLVDALDERPTLHEEIEARLLALYGAVAA
ncbi:MAG: alpha-amylase, partial [Roseiflexaceae bacterium]|nr:alpha-amylase [Roseiflexaceae bacterium]